VIPGTVLPTASAILGSPVVYIGAPKPLDVPAVEFGRTPNARINYLSVSQLKSARLCLRKWYLKKVVGLDEPMRASLELGTLVHAQLEHYLKTGENTLGEIAAAALPYLPEPKTSLGYEVAITETVRPVIKSKLTADGIPLVGFIDRIDQRPGRAIRVVDYKTSKDPEKWAATPEQLTSTEHDAGIQMVGYAVSESEELPVDEVELEHLILHTKPTKKDRAEGRTAKQVIAKITPKKARDEWERMNLLARKLREVAKAKTLDEVEPSWESCGAFGGCAFHATCLVNECRSKTPTPNGEKPMSLADILAKRKALSAPPQTSIVPVPATVPPTVTVTTTTTAASAPEPVPQVVPPDAPPSDPAKAADPLPNPDMEKNPDAEKPKRGRKPKASADAATVTHAAVEMKTDAADAMIAEVKKTLTETPSGFNLFIDCIPSSGAIAFAGYVDARLDTIREAFPDLIDVRLAPKKGKNAEGKDVDHPLAYGGWKGVLAAECRLNPPQGNLCALGVYGSEFMQVAIEALEPLAKVVVRGVR